MKPQTKAEHFDVIIVGAGISGIGSAYHLKQQSPNKRFLILEGKESFGGTWHTHRYPGVRSDSDLYTFGYRFKPWTGVPIATGQEILDYLGETIVENDLAQYIRYQHRIISSNWSSVDSLWTLEVASDSGETIHFTCNFLWMCNGYYHHDKGYTPEWSGMESFKGQIIHPQTWPEGENCKGKRVVVIGSGATAATIIPAMASDCEHITMLQRSATYFAAAENAIPIADTLRALNIDESWIHEIVRRQINYEKEQFIVRTLEDPETTKEELLSGVRAYLPEEEVAKNFTPNYRPWSQRVAFVPDGDLFKGIQSGKASVVTGEIDRFVENGILLKSGQLLEADVIVTATGFNLASLGGIEFSIDGEPLVFGETVTYRGMMFTGVPNFLWVMGYFRYSWTCRVDILGDFVCRLLNHMSDNNIKRVEVALRPEDKDMQILPWVDPKDFNPGYLLREGKVLPNRGDKLEWSHSQDYFRELVDIPATSLNDPVFVYDGKKIAS